MDPLTSATSELYKRVTIKRTERTYIIDITARAITAEKSARLANSVMQTYLDMQNENRTENSRKTTGFLVSRLDELKEKVRLSEDATENFRVKNDLIGAKGSLVSEQQLSDANFQLSSAKARTGDAKSRFDQIMRAKKNGDISGISEAIASQVVTSLRAQQGETSRKLSELSLELGTKHPQVLNAKAQMSDLSNMINEELNRIAEAMKNDLERAESTERSATEALDKLKGLSATNNQSSVQLREMEREVEANRQLYNAFLVRSRETNELEKLDTSNTRIISMATPPFFKSFPPSGSLLVLLGLIIGGMIGLGQAFARSFIKGMKNA
jgi:polysaccharide biosynthesis transport protein